MKNKSVLARVVAGCFAVALYCVNTIAITGFTLASSTTSADANCRGRGCRGRGRGRGRGYWRGRGRGRGVWWPGACHIPGTSLWYGSCW